MTTPPADSAALTVKVFADGANLDGIRKLAADPLIAGFTTNPTLMREAGITNYEQFGREVLEVVDGRPVSFEVFADDHAQIVQQALKLSSWGANVYVKIPVTTTSGEPTTALIRELAAEGVQQNVTALMTLDQVRWVRDALADGPPANISVFAGRVADTGRDPVPMMRQAVADLAAHDQIELIWASPREVLNIVQADEVGCHIITVTHGLLAKLSLLGRDLDLFSLDTVRMFHDDAHASGFQLSGADDWDLHWSEYAESAEQNPAQTWRRDLVIERLDLTPGVRVLDVGSGQGDLARDLLVVDPTLDVHGLELAASGVAHATTKVPGATFHQIDLLAPDPRLDELVGWADRVVCTEVLEHLDQPEELLTNALVHAKPGARVVVTVPAGPRTAFDVHIGHRRHYTRASLRMLLERTGVEVTSVDAAGFPFFNLYRLVVLVRGRKLIDDVASRPDDARAGAVDSRVARTVLAVFDRLFGLNRRRGRMGWQLIAVGRVASHR